ncbi:hypothetical protein RI129_012077 [Pyrocoelia pectoralis]|uniref:DDE Tnp4 domain-containing protein n=1 Tax=Pyrocoelia pectoralis TaxID=417401 RepID=A0AAN7UYF1_9COLE
MADLYEFIQYVEDDVAYLPIPRQVLRDNGNPLEVYTNNELYQRYRFCRETIQTTLLPMVYPLYNRESNRGLPIPPIIKLCMALRFYATGSYQRTVGDLMAISQSSACRIINEVSEIIARQLPRYIKFPGRDIARNRRRFYEIAHFPGVIGCIDGTHIEICSPGGPTAETFRNRKGWMSINVQVVCGPNNEICDIVIRWPGSAHDSRIFNSSAVKLKFEDGTLSGLLLGDSAYQQSQYLFTPILNPQTPAEHRYNTAHIQTRTIVERTFGIWKGRFRCLHLCLNNKLRNAIRIIAATAVLHNIAISQREEFPLLQEDENRGNIPVRHLNDRENVRGNAIRAAFIHRHFMN